MLTRKGIYQTFEADGAMSADERWQIVASPNGDIQIDTETIRLRPFPEPRSEAVTLYADVNLNVELLTIHGLQGHREARVNFDHDLAYFCWQFKRETHRIEHAWSARHEIGYNSTLFNTLTIRRLRLGTGESRRFSCAWLDQLTYEPHWIEQTYTRHANEPHETRFGARVLQHYSLRVKDDAIESEIWCDESGVVFDLAASDGSRFVLTAVNFPD